VVDKGTAYVGRDYTNTTTGEVIPADNYLKLSCSPVKVRLAELMACVLNAGQNADGSWKTDEDMDATYSIGSTAGAARMLAMEEEHEGAASLEHHIRRLEQADAPIERRNQAMLRALEEAGGDAALDAKVQTEVDAERRRASVSDWNSRRLGASGSDAMVACEAKKGHMHPTCGCMVPGGGPDLFPTSSFAGVTKGFVFEWDMGNAPCRAAKAAYAADPMAAAAVAWSAASAATDSS